MGAGTLVNSKEIAVFDENGTGTRYVPWVDEGEYFEQ
jgi:hypothetical protein